MSTKLQHSLKGNGHGEFGERRLGRHGGGRSFGLHACVDHITSQINRQMQASWKG